MLIILLKFQFLFIIILFIKKKNLFKFIEIWIALLS